MCLITLKSYKYQLFAVLDALYKAQTVPEYITDKDGDEKEKPIASLESMVNNIVFGIPSPPRRFEYFNEYLFPDGNSEIQQTPRIVEISLEPYLNKKVYIQNENPFDVTNSRFENIWVLLNTLSPENVIMIFKRLLFNTCNILVCKDQEILNKCI